MHPWLRVPYAATSRFAELIAAVTPSGASSKLGRTFAGRKEVRRRYISWGATGRDRSRPLLWIHAPSVGEGLMALPLMQRVREEMPEVQLAYTFFSPSAESFAQQSRADFSAYLPFDTSTAAREIVEALQPTAIVFSKLDVWPVLAEHARRRGVRLGLLSASMPARSLRYGVGALITKDAYAALDWIGAASVEDAKRLIAAGARADRIQVTGDTRYDQAWGRAYVQPRNEAIVAALRSDRVTLVAGSTWPSDERELLPAWERVRNALPAARLIIAPHEPREEELARIETWATKAGLQANRLSAPNAAGADVIVADRLGLLADLYALSDVTYVGGGFHQAGLHSMVEPGVFYKPVVIGPRHDASRDAGLILGAGGAIAVRDAGEMAQVLQRLLMQPEERDRMARALAGVVAQQRGAMERSFDVIRGWMASGRSG